MIRSVKKYSNATIVRLRNNVRITVSDNDENNSQTIQFKRLLEDPIPDGSEVGACITKLERNRVLSVNVSLFNHSLPGLVIALMSQMSDEEFAETLNHVGVLMDHRIPGINEEMIK